MALANTLAGLTLSQIAARSLKALLPDLYMMKMFACDLSDEIEEKGGSVQTRYAPKTAIQDVSGGYAAALQNSTSTGVTVILSNQKGYVYGFKDSEISTIGLQTLDKLFTEPARNATITGIMGDLLALVTPGNFPNSSVIASPNADAIADLAEVANTTYIPKKDRFLLMNSAFNNSLVKDTAIQAIYASGSGLALRENQAGRLSTFDTYEYTEVPPANNLVAIAGNPDGLVFAARQPAVPFAPQVEVENVIDPDSGLPLQYRMWYDAPNKQLVLSVECLYGMSVGNPGMIRRVTSA